MKTLKFLLWILFASQATYAQHVKVSLTEGLGLDANKKNDSLFFAKSYSATQLRASYHYGKLGLLLGTTYILQKVEQGADDRIPNFVLQTNKKISNVKTWNTTLGLELCIPFLKHKAQCNVYAAYGISFSKSDSVVFYDLTLPTYSHKAQNKSTGCLQTGFTLSYKFNSHIGAKWQNEYNAYKLPYDAIDIRKTPSQFSGLQKKQLFISSIGLQYTF